MASKVTEQYCCRNRNVGSFEFGQHQPAAPTMCTVSWLSQPGGGYQVFFNRDEQPQRPSRGPARSVTAGIPYLAPRDEEAGGTWIAVNVLGVTLGMTNQYPVPAPPPPVDPVSRGLLLTSLVDASSLKKIQSRLGSLPLQRYRPFAIAAFAHGEAPVSHRWDGTTMTVASHPEPGFVLTSSGAVPPKLEETRRALFAEAIERGGLSAETLAMVHRSHRPERGSLSVCMHRTEAQTVSYCHITVGAAGEIAFRYAPGPPCITPVGQPLMLSPDDRPA